MMPSLPWYWLSIRFINFLRSWNILYNVDLENKNPILNTTVWKFLYVQTQLYLIKHFHTKT